MAKRRGSAGNKAAIGEEAAGPALPRAYRRACKLVEERRYDDARRAYGKLEVGTDDPRLKALIVNDLAVLEALDGNLEAARASLLSVLTVDDSCEPARLNAALLNAEFASPTSLPVSASLAVTAPSEQPAGPIRVAILSFLFNWPSTGGGTVHTAELARFLAGSGYEVRHFYARHLDWGVGRVDAPTPHPSQAIDFDDASWNLPEIQARFRRDVDAFGPDHIIITDSWNMKPILAEAVRDYPYILRLQALECLCPLNNVRLLPDPERGGVRQCHLHQFASPHECARCVQQRGQMSGSLHQAERALSGFGTPEYHERLLRTFREAEAVLVVNPLTEAMVSPYAQCVRVVTAGMDPARFPWPPPLQVETRGAEPRKTLFFAGLVDEWMKGYNVLHEACRILWERRRDFELVVTAEPSGQADEFTRFIGWQSQENLPAHLYAADILVMPTIAQEALGRTAVEAMAAGKPVIASRIGGLPFTVADGATGLLCEPGDAVDLARKIEIMLDDPALCERMGLAGRRRFEEHYDWNVIVERHYHPILKRNVRTPQLAPRAAYRPFIPDRVDHKVLIAHASQLFAMGNSEVEAKFDTYRSFHDAKDYARNLGEFKTLCFEEAFLLYVILSRFQPSTIVEVGTQHGKSTRRILDMVNLLGLASRVICFDQIDEVHHFDRREAELIVGDKTGVFREEVLRTFKPQLIFLDVHNYGLLKEAISETLSEARCILAIHDCGRGLCNPHMTLAKEDPAVTSLTGVWERHILAETFGVADPLSERLDAAASPTHRMRIFDTPHGLAVIIPEVMLAAGSSPARSDPHRE